MVQFFSEIITRLFSKKPWFFKVLQIVAGIVALVNVALPSAATIFHLDATTSLYKALTSGVGFAIALTAAITSQLTVSPASPAADSLKK